MLVSEACKVVVVVVVVVVVLGIVGLEVFGVRHPEHHILGLPKPLHCSL